MRQTGKNIAISTFLRALPEKQCLTFRNLLVNLVGYTGDIAVSFGWNKNLLLMVGGTN